MNNAPVRNANFRVSSPNFFSYFQRILRLAPIFCVMTVWCWTTACAQDTPPTDSASPTDYSRASMEAYEKKDFPEAERLILLTLKEAEKAEKQMNSEASRSYEFAQSNLLSRLADVYCREQKWSEAEATYKRVLKISEQIHGFVSETFKGLGECYRTQRKYSEAEDCFRRALESDQKGDAMNTSIADSANNVGVILTEQEKYSDAEPFYKLALKVEEGPRSPFDPHLIPDLNVLVDLYKKEAARKAQATQAIVQNMTTEHLCKLYLARQVEPKLKKQYDIDSVHGGPTSSLRGTLLAAAYVAQGKYDDAEPVLKDALIGTEYMLPPDFNGYAMSDQPEPKDPTFGNDNPDVAKVLNNLAELYVAQGKYAQAEPLLKRSLLITKNILGENHPRVATTLNIYTQVLRNTGKDREAGDLESKIKFILTPQH